ncbi:hypothetical protein APF79_02065 [bacterium BRH_c32]|nr:MAG: hypothetical protein APF79_02065 [bacterium BRH_c32]
MYHYIRNYRIKNIKIFGIGFGFLALAALIYFIIPSGDDSIEWNKFDLAIYENSINEGEPIIIDFYADWCIPCKELDKQTFSDKRVIELSKKFVMIKADMTKTLSEETAKIANKFNIVGMPTVLIIDSKGKELERLTGFVNADEFLKIMQKAY